MDDSMFDKQAETRETEFPAVIKFTTAGQRFWGTYIGTELIPQKEPKKPIRAHVFELKGYDGCSFEKGKKVVTVKEGERVSLSGQRLDRALQPSDLGASVRVIYDGREEEGRGGNNPAHLFTVQVIPLKSGVAA